jgi:hypothetical protein
MNFQEKAREIVDKYWKVESERFPNPYLLEKDISDAITQAYNDGLERGAEISESFKRYADQSYYDEVAQAIRGEIKK